MPVSKNWANLKSFLRKTYNREVNEWFRDEPENVPDNSTPRKQSKRACLILPKETQNTALIKTLTFRYVVQQVHLRPEVFGTPVEPYQEKVAFRPHVHLYFRQDASAVANGRRAMEGEISFRLIDETSETMTEAKAKALALDIKRELATGNGYIWKKGKYSIVCQDPENGLNLKIYALNELEGIEVVQKLYDIIGKPYDETKVRIVEPKRDSETNPSGNNLVYGKLRRKKRWRPIGNVRFQYAVLTVHGMPHRIILVDRTKRYLNALEWV